MCTLLFFFKQKTAYEVRINDWSSDVCSSDPLEAVATAKRIFAKGCAIEVLHPRRRYDPGRHPEAAVTALDFVEDARRAKSAKETAAGRKVKKALGITGGRKMVYSDEDLIKAHATMMREKRSLRDVERDKIGRASWRERGCQYVKISVVAVSLKK